MSKERKSNLIEKLKFLFSNLEPDKVYEVSDLDHITALNLKAHFREYYNVFGPSIDEENSKLFAPRYRLAFMIYQQGVKNA